jgi:hypothetical protein
MPVLMGEIGKEHPETYTPPDEKMAQVCAESQMDVFSGVLQAQRVTRAYGIVRM